MNKESSIERMIDYANRMFPKINVDKAERYRWKSSGNLSNWGSYHCANVRSFYINHAYQRESLSTTTINSITRDFDYRLFVPIIINAKNNCVIDGAHRVVAAIRRDVITIPYNSVWLDTEEDEAALFVKYNEKTNAVKAMDKYRAGLVAGDELCAAVQAMASRADVSFANSKYGLSKTCGFVRELLKATKANAIDAEKSLLITKAIAVDEALKNSVFRGVFYLVNNGVRIDTYVEKILRAGGYTIILNKEKRLAVEYPTMSPARRSALAILEVINAGLRKKISMPGFTAINQQQR